MAKDKKNMKVTCALCQKVYTDFKLLVNINKSFHICFYCAENGVRILPSTPPTSSDLTLMKPSEIKTALDQHVIGQDAAKKALAVA